MANNIIDPRGSHTAKMVTVTGGVVAGSLQIVGATPMIPLDTTTSAGVTVTCLVGAAAVLTKEAKALSGWSAGGRVYYATTSGGDNVLTGVATAGELIGYGLEAAATGDVTGRVRLIDGPSPLETQT